MRGSRGRTELIAHQDHSCHEYGDVRRHTTLQIQASCPSSLIHQSLAFAVSDTSWGLSNGAKRLTGEGPFTHEVKEVLHLRNRNAEPVAFKVRGCTIKLMMHQLTGNFIQVKTTAPKQ